VVERSELRQAVSERQTHDYVRGGTTPLFAVLDIATWQVISALHQRHRAVEFRKFLVRINNGVPAGLSAGPDLLLVVVVFVPVLTAAGKAYR
jgi:hypothetical protein